MVRYFSSNESKFIYECIDKPTKKPSTCSVIATCKNETTIYLFSDIIHHVLKNKYSFNSFSRDENDETILMLQKISTWPKISVDIEILTTAST